LSTTEGRSWPAATVYLLYEGAFGFLFTLMGTVYSVYAVIDAELSAFQLLMLGTILEGTVLVFEVPTGVVADVVSRRTSVIVGTFVTGAAFVVVGAVPTFVALAIGSFLYGVGATFISGAEEAWITDEVGEKAATKLYVRGAQWAQFAALGGIILSVALATIALNLPILICGSGLLVLGMFLIIRMPETRVRPEKDPETRMHRSMRRTFKSGIGQIKTRPVLALIFAVAIFHGMSTEGFDRLYALHLIDHTVFPDLGPLDPVVWFGIIQAVGLLLAIGVSEFIKRKVDISTHRGAAGSLALFDILLIAAVVVFGLTGNFWLALGSFWLVALAREAREPIFTAWINQGLDPASRATVNSLGGQMDALGQMAGGPALGVVAVWRSVQSAIVVSGLLRLPSLALFGRTLRQPPAEGHIAPDALDTAAIEVTGMPGPPGPSKLPPSEPPR
jgi:MFS transporter, DHA3 family, tetracycline resistance protein